MRWWFGLGKDYKFNLSLNPKNEDHMEVARILETLHKRGSKTQMVVDCILLCCGKRPANASAPPLIQQVIRDEVQKALNGQDMPANEPVQAQPQKSITAPAMSAPKPEPPTEDDVDKNLLLKSMQDFGL